MLDQSILSYNDEIKDCKVIENSEWMTNGKSGKEETFLLNIEEPFKIELSQDGDDFEGYIAGYKIQWNESKNDWYVYRVTKVRPTNLSYNDENEDYAKQLFQMGATMITHRKFVNYATNGETLKRPNTKTIKKLLVE